VVPLPLSLASASGRGLVSAWLAVIPRERQGDAGGGGSGGEVGPTVGPSPPGPLHLCFSDLGLGLRFCTVKSIRDRFLVPFFSQLCLLTRTWLWYNW
jgi:hypothetical protein